LLSLNAKMIESTTNQINNPFFEIKNVLLKNLNINFLF
jgi:hypothetical protein